ncbi:MAG: hypothetical protein WBV81_06120 [Ignavibacteriaceae bacterium]
MSRIIRFKFMSKTFRRYEWNPDPGSQLEADPHMAESSKVDRNRI